jgi:hypothetical protein
VPRYAAILDACVLVPIALADTLLRIAEKGLYRPLWSDRILDEAQAAIEVFSPRSIWSSGRGGADQADTQTLGQIARSDAEPPG